MKYWVTYPIAGGSYDAELVSGAAIARFTRAAEAAGFDGIGFTDHPAPSDKWLRSGGHDALDPFAALAFAAANSQRLQLIPNIVVLPYRNPFLVAKLSATLDALSGGRFVLSTALGYLRSEYRSLGVDYQVRNELFDEALEVLRGVWTTDAFAFEGTGYTASGVSANPKPGHIPIWLGGNSQRTRRRVAAVTVTAGTLSRPRRPWRRRRVRCAWRPPTTCRRCSTTCGRRSTRPGRERSAIDVAFTAAHGDVAVSGLRRRPPPRPARRAERAGRDVERRQRARRFDRARPGIPCRVWRNGDRAFAEMTLRQAQHG